LLQILCLVAMERPCSPDPEEIRNEKVCGFHLIARTVLNSVLPRSKC
jgi:glucose-6-phosphate 1-dehydrogenase